MKSAQEQFFKEPILNHIRTDFGLLRHNWTVNETITHLRQLNVGDKILYFYVVDEHDRLQGVVPTRKLLLSPADQKLGEIISRRVVTLPKQATVFDAFEFFVLHKYFALPVVDEERRVLGVVEINLVTDEAVENPEHEDESLFEILGLHLAETRNAGPVKSFRYRFPWLMVTILGGTGCALISGFFEETLQELVVLSFFLPMVLGLADAVSMQSMTMSIQALRVKPPTLGWYFSAVRKEATTATLLGVLIGALIALIVWTWRGQPGASAIIGLSVALTFQVACFMGMSIPALLHALKLDPKVAAGPMTLAITDMIAVMLYFGLAAVALR